MTKETFAQAVEIMVNALQTAHQDKRVLALYEFFGEHPFQAVKDASRLAAKELDRFPTPATFAAFIGRVTQPQSGTQERALCNRCNGYGWVEFEGEAYRGRCSHGAQLSEKIKLAPESYESKPSVGKMTDTEMAERVAENPLRYARGAIWLTDGRPEGHAEPMQRIVNLVRTIVGEKIWEEEVRRIRGHQRVASESGLEVLESPLNELKSLNREKPR